MIIQYYLLNFNPYLIKIYKNIYFLENSIYRDILCLKVFEESILQNNILSETISEFSALPLWIRQAIFLKLASNPEISALCETFGDYAIYIPELTFKGQNELSNKSGGYDLNIYNFLSGCFENKSIVEISVSTYLTIEEVANIFQFCVLQGLVGKPENRLINAGFEYMSGKIRLGEYLVKIGKIEQSQLDFALKDFDEQKIIDIDLMFGQFLKKSYPELSTVIDIILKLKYEAQKRYIFDKSKISVSGLCSDGMNQDSEIRRLRDENRGLKNKYSTMAKLIKAGIYE